MTEALNAEKIGIFLTDEKNAPPALTQLHKHFSTNKHFEVAYKTFEELQSELVFSKKSIVLFTVTDSDNVNEIREFSRLIRSNNKTKSIFPIAILKSSNQKIEDILSKIGCAEVLTFSVTFKSLLHKVNRYVKILELKKSEIADTSIKTERADASESLKNKLPNDMVMFKDPIDSKNDFWLFVKKSHAKKYLSKWIVELIGPSPMAGTWEKTKKFDAIIKIEMDVWEWKSRDEKSYFYTSDGSWVFVGAQPEYNWVINRWAFVSESPELSFIADSKISFSRFKAINPQILRISNNSKHGNDAFAHIKNTYDKTHRFAQSKSEIPWDDKVDSDQLEAKDWNQGDLSKDEDKEWNNSLKEEADFLKNLLTVPGYKIRGTLNNEAIELLGFGSEDNAIFVGLSPEFVKEEELVTLRLFIDNITRTIEHVIAGSILKIQEIEPNKYIAKILVLPESLPILDKIKKTFLERQKHASSFIMRAKGEDSNEKIIVKDKNTANDEVTSSGFLKNNYILIIDSVSSARTSLASTLIKLGASRNQMSLVGSLEEAKEIFQTKNPKIIFSDYMIGNKSGLSFLQELKASSEKTGINDKIFLLVTSNASQSAVAKAAEGDIDSFVIKPYSFDNLKNVLYQTIQNKLNPNPYLKLVSDGKNQFALEDYYSAKKTFTDAVKTDPEPALALSFLGRISVFEKDFEKAEKFFRDGLALNEIHFECLNGLHDVLSEQKKHLEAYQVAKNLVKYFPANTKRLSNVLQAAVVTDNFTDIKDFYTVYLNIDERNEELVRYVCSAMLVAGKYYLKRNEPKSALELFENAAISAAGKEIYLFYIIETLVNYKMEKESAQFLKRLYNISPASREYQAANFLVQSMSLPTIDVVHQGRELLKKGIEFPSVYEKLIHHSAIAGYHDSAKELAAKAALKWPDKNQFNFPASQ